MTEELRLGRLKGDLALIERWLRERDESRLAALFSAADDARRASVGDEVHLRGLVEISNYCARRCAYCGLRADRRDIARYRMGADEILDCARKAKSFGYGTLVMQSGEDDGIEAKWMADLIARIKLETGLAVTLSLGERDEADLRLWRDAGADRYLLRFETSDRALFERIHPPRPGRACDRIAMLRLMRGLGFEIGSGVMVGIPGQGFASLARDIQLFSELDLDMIGLGPFIPHPDTPLGRDAGGMVLPPDEQVPNTEEMTYVALALARLICPQANIPATTALATLNTESGREKGLQCGANVVMPNLTPLVYRESYEIYPGKACVGETAEACQRCMERRILKIGRRLGRGAGGRRDRGRAS